MNRERIMLSEIARQRRKILYDITYMWNIEIQQITEYSKKRFADTENKRVYQWGEGMEERK